MPAWLGTEAVPACIRIRDCCNNLGVFLPAAGNRWNDNLNDVGSWGNYWSSSLNPNNDNGAYYLYFYSGIWYWGTYGSRCRGLSVRAVRP